MYILIPKGSLTPLKDARYLVKALHVKVFQLRPTATVWALTQSRAVAARLQDSMVSGNHCQEGTDIKVFRVRGIKTQG